jgi:hypothetical protein
VARDLVWQGLNEEWVCHGRQEVVDTFTGQRDEAREVDALELIGAERHAVLRARGAGVLEMVRSLSSDTACAAA